MIHDYHSAILFVDDEERIVRLLKMIFRTQYKVFTALSAADALEILDANRVDVIVCDQRMPSVTGIELLAQVRLRRPEVVRILLTGYSDLVAIIGSVNQGEVHRFLNKPWDQTEIRETIAEAAELADSLRQTLDAVGPLWNGDAGGPQFSVTSQVLVLDEVEADCESIAGLLAEDYEVVVAASVVEAIEILSSRQVGVIITAAELGSLDVTDLLAEIAGLDPAITVVATNAAPHSDAVIKLINAGRIFRFAIKPINAALVQTAVNDAMREHHRRLADPRVVRRRMRTGAFAGNINENGDNSPFKIALRRSIRRNED
ncbi:DNA-binding NtrC family response regulator [Agrobacterium larrymoorei]|uniref:DNA-binding NtrC family response regulator n=1 Tax=Agrobacterium larrymoorei TaxID=160699 RepID=A0AAJ2ERF2_9HYPH|nr:response regulator [Agrobacterium larrymoorei]MDR6101739.1 DNA-binding NtrC family response regulator [Agrobacterium larrymoorei]